METMANIWLIWLLGVLVAIVYSGVMYSRIFLSIIKDNNTAFDLKIYRRLWDYGIGIALVFIFGVLLIISGIANIIAAITG